MNDRLFTFGCSFTNFFWPTWADILGREFKQFENWGMNGAGNCFQLYSLMECHKRNKLSTDDTVIIMWSSIDREDRWINGHWFLEGGIYNGQEPYTAEYVEKFADPTGFLIRDLAVISATRQLLDSIGCQWYFLSMVPLYYQDKSFYLDSVYYDLDDQIIDLYQDDLYTIRSSIYETVFNSDWYSRPGYCDLSAYENDYKNLKGSDWPSITDFVNQNFTGIKKSIMKEIQNLFKLDKRLIRTDCHPTPSEHLEYLDKILPEIKISNSTRLWAETQNKRVLDLDPFYANTFRGKWKTNVPNERF